MYRARTLAIAAKSNYKNNWTAKYKVNLETRVDKTYHLACYYSIPTDNSSNTLLPAKINATLCTHLIVAFAQVQNNSVYLSSSDMEVRYLILSLLKYCFSSIYLAFSNKKKPYKLFTFINCKMMFTFKWVFMIKKGAHFGCCTGFSW